MNQNKFISQTLVLLFAFIYFTGCQKSTEQLLSPNLQHDISTARQNPEKLVVRKTRIEKIIQHDLPFYYVPTRTGVFEYNKWGDPVRIIFDFNSSDENTTNWIFRYNQKHQLTDALKSYPASYLVWSKYVYDHKGTIIRDTTQFFGQLQGETPLPGMDTLVNIYSYDSQGRISRVHRQWDDRSDDLFYNYDSNGNLTRTAYNTQGQPITLTYDNQVNPQRTHEVFMFVARDYSRNNAASAQSYNDMGLPLAFRQQSRTALFLGADMATADIIYAR